MIEGLTSSTPRVNYESMQTHIGKRVCLAGKVEQVENGRVLVKTSDGATVTVMSNPSGSGVYDSLYIEVYGQVVDQRTLQEEDHINVQDNFDLNMYNELVKLSTGRYQSLF